jgi:hypothetical protein
MPTSSPVARQGEAGGAASGEASFLGAYAAPADLADPQATEALEQACFGAGLPAAAEVQLRQASRAYADEPAAERHLLSAMDLAPDHPAVYIGLYRFYFYRNRLREALAIGLRCLALAAAVNGLPDDWRHVRPAQASFDGYAVLPRFYLFTLKACAYLHLRLGEFASGAAMLDQLMRLDPSDKLKGSVLRAVLDDRGRDDDE